MRFAKNNDQERKPSIATRVLAGITVGAMSFTQAGAIILNVADASRDLADVPWPGQGAERMPLNLAYTQLSTEHVDLASIAMGKQVGGVRYLVAGKPSAYDIAFTDVSSGACGTCT